MPRFYDDTPGNIGLPPGTPIHTGEGSTVKVKITVMDYDEDHFQEREVERVEECFPFKEKNTVTWINVDGVHDVNTVEKLCTHYGIHPLVTEDIVDTKQRPKMDDFDDYIYIVLRMLMFDNESDTVTSEQVSMILGEGVLITFQEKIGDVFEMIRTRIRNNKGRIRKLGPDYLAYSLIDAIVDNYFTILENIGGMISFVEEEMMADPSPDIMHFIHDLKRDVLFLRKSVWPLREVINNIQKAESPLIKETTEVYLRDVYDHTIQVMDTVEVFRDMLSGMLDIYLSSLSNRLNQVMKVLTIIATIFMPLTFITGVYGMNFKYLPGIGWHWGYFMTLGVMLAVAIFMLAYFKRNKWL